MYLKTAWMGWFARTATASQGTNKRRRWAELIGRIA
jgi:hypothetical protein